MWASPKRGPLADLSTPKDQKPVVTKAWNDLKPPKTIYNHLKPPTTTSKNSTTTSKTSTTTRKQSKTI